MLTQGEAVNAHALRERGWSVSAIARHLRIDRKTVRVYLSGGRVPGQRKPAGPDRFGPFAEYCRIRFADDPHLQSPARAGRPPGWAMTAGTRRSPGGCGPGG